MAMLFLQNEKFSNTKHMRLTFENKTQAYLRKGETSCFVYKYTLFVYTGYTCLNRSHQGCEYFMCSPETFDFIGLLYSPVIITASHLKTDNYEFPFQWEFQTSPCRTSNFISQEVRHYFVFFSPKLSRNMYPLLLHGVKGDNNRHEVTSRHGLF